jgi:hypothetical protein
MVVANPTLSSLFLFELCILSVFWTLTRLLSSLRVTLCSSLYHYQSTDPTLSLFSYSYALFCTAKNGISNRFMLFRTLCTKHPGWGLPSFFKSVSLSSDDFTSNSHRIIFFAHPHPLTPLESYSCKKQGEGVCIPPAESQSFSMRSTYSRMYRRVRVIPSKHLAMRCIAKIESLLCVLPQEPYRIRPRNHGHRLLRFHNISPVETLATTVAPARPHIARSTAARNSSFSAVFTLLSILAGKAKSSNAKTHVLERFRMSDDSNASPAFRGSGFSIGVRPVRCANQPACVTFKSPRCTQNWLTVR